MSRFLLFLSILISGLLPLRAQDDSAPGADDGIRRFACEISMERGGITGILVTRCDADAITGSIVNEFGVSAMDFTYHLPSDKIKLHHVVSFLDKWYVKRTLKQDLKICMSEIFGLPRDSVKGYETSVRKDTWTICNKKRKLRYTFEKLAEPYEPDETEE